MPGIHVGMEAHASGSDLVRCLACRTVYSKPSDGRLPKLSACPSCDYVGWIAVSIPLPPPRPSGFRESRI